MEPLKKLIVRGTMEKNEEGVTTYYLAASDRDSAEKHDIELKEEDPLIELTLDDEAGTTWVVDKTTMHELFPEMDPAIPNAQHRGGNSFEFELPGAMDTPASERGIVGKVALKLLTVFSKKNVVTSKVGDIAKKLENKHLLNNLPEDENNPMRKKLAKRKFLENGAELFTVNSNFEFDIFEAPKTVKKNKDTGEPEPYFLFIHGTNSDTLGAFEDLKDSIVWKTLFKTYGDNVIAIQHRTLTESPLENALKLADLLPDGVKLHILSHSRGGIVGDIIDRYNKGNKNARGFSQKHIDLLNKEGRENDVATIEKLNKLYKNKSVIVEKFIRVACPAAGTKLASKRLDHILNVFTNLLPGIAGDILKELLMAAVNSKDDVDVLPGLEAQNPDSPFLKVLNDPSKEAAISGKPLAVISGNGTVSASGKGLLIILGKLFYWQRNDLVVNTDSMYLGASRKDEIKYFFDQGPEVDHVKYFKNKRTRDAINLVIEADMKNPIPGFKSVLQNEVPSTDRALLESGELKPDDNLPTGDRPILILLPGIMGSNLTTKKRKREKELWLHYGRILTGGLTQLDLESGNQIDATSVVKTSYNKLYKWLSNKYDVIVYPFDWRIPLQDSAVQLNTKIESLLSIATEKKLPIKIIGHSMGGVLVRDFIVNHKGTWDKLNKRDGFKLIYLGAPLGGSHRILTVLFGKDAIINKLSKLDLVHTKKTLLHMFSQFPGILGLLPLTTGKGEDYADIKLWERLRDYFGKDDWPLPKSEDLDEFGTYRDGVNKWFKDASAEEYSNMVYIAGKDKITPIGYYLDDYLPKDKERLRFLYTGEGDQSVSWELGIPERLIDNKSVYYTRFSHGALANAPEMFDGIEEILSTGKTKLFSKIPPKSRDDSQVFSADPDVDFDISEKGLENTIFGLAPSNKFEEGQIPLNVTITNGDLRYATHPVLAGHFLYDGILYAERAIDRYLNGGLSHKHKLGLYPGAIGTNAIFETTDDSDFVGAIIVGMGEPDFLTSQELSKSVEQGVLNYLISLSGKEKKIETVGISALIMASGYGGLTIESSMKAVISGVNQANSKVKGLNSSIYQTVENLEFIERNSDRALNCMYIANGIVLRENDNYHIAIGNTKMLTRLGIKRRILMDSSNDWWNRITVKYYEGNEETGEMPSMVFGASTSDSRHEESRIFSSTTLIDLFISKASKKNDWDNCTAKTLFELLIPNEMKEKLRRKGNVSWILDKHTASYPWELLQDDAINAKPLCIHAGMIRQLATQDYRKDIKRVAEKGALIVADPVLNGFIGQLPGARKEGRAVWNILEEANYPVSALIEEDAANIITNFFCSSYSIIHLAGHGVFNEKFPNQSGMVIGEKLFLSVFQIQQLPVVPELVFVNCCHLGAINSDDEEYYRDRYKLAANIGTQLISIGVKAVIAAGWVVNDEAALDFAKEFYKHMFNGNSFGDAVKKARSYIFENHPGNNTWGAYQCYGDPFFRISNISKGEWTPSYFIPLEAEIDLENTMNDIEMGLNENANYLEDLMKIENALEKDRKTLLTAEVVEKLARIYYQLADYEKAKDKFDALLGMEKADFSLSALEIYCNTRVKWEVQKVSAKGSSLDTQKKRREFQTSQETAYPEVLEVIAELGLLLKVSQTAKRLNLLGSTYKRLSMLTSDRDQIIDSLQRAFIYYKAAFDYYKKENVVYPLTNAIELSAILKLSGVKETQKFKVNFDFNQYIPKEPKENQESKTKAGGKKKPDTFLNTKLYSGPEAKKLLMEERENIKPITNESKVDYWDMLKGLNIDMCLLMVDRNNDNEDKDWVQLQKDFNIIWKKAGSQGKKLAELEHLKIIIYTLSKLHPKPEVVIPPHKTIATAKDLSDHIEKLRESLDRYNGTSK